MPLGLPVLAYHNIGPRGSPANFLTEPLEQLERQMDWLSEHGYATVRTDELIAWRSGKRLPDKAVMISFDDGYEGIGTHALPVLQRYGFSAVVFVVTARLGRTNEWDDLTSRAPLMSAETIASWAAQGFEFGSHSRTHRDLTTLAAAELEDEIRGSRDELAHILRGMPAPATFCYPWGKFNRRVLDCVGRSYRMAFSVRRGTNFRSTDPYLMRRSMIHPDCSMLDFSSRVTFGFSPWAGVNRVAQKYLRTPWSASPIKVKSSS